MEKTLISLTKDNPDLYLTIPISEYDCLGESLPFINFNFESVDIALTNLQFSADNYWNVASSFIIDNEERWDSIITDFEELADTVNPVLSSIESLSAHWLSPISVVYPTPLTTPNSTIALEWLNDNYPVNLNNLSDPICYEYMQNQRIYVFFPRKTSSGDIYINKFYGYEYKVLNEAWVFVRNLPGY